MEYVKLSNTDVKVSKICLGTMTWGCQNTEEEAHAQMDMALDCGVNFFDTAEMYAVPPAEETCGKTEEIIGSWFKKSGAREKIVLASKAAGPGIKWIRGGNYSIDRENIIAALDGSLRRLQTDYIDLYQLHWPNRGSYHFGHLWDYEPRGNKKEISDNFMEVLNTLQELINQGKIRHIGISNETAWGTMAYLRLAEENNLPKPVSIQNEYSLLCRLFEPDLAEVSLRENIGLLAWSPLASGMLTGKYAGGKIPQGTRWSIRSGKNHRNNPGAHAAVDAYLKVAQKHNLDPAQMALAFVNSRPFLTSNIIGATNLKQLKTNIESINIKLTDEVLKDIDNVRRDYPITY